MSAVPARQDSEELVIVDDAVPNDVTLHKEIMSVDTSQMNDNIQIVDDEPLTDGFVTAGGQVTAALPDEAKKQSPVEIEGFDVVIVGAGISGINMAYRISTLCKGKSYVILDRRDSMGGTWDIMRYPGIRSDSDLHTFGFAWRPWMHANPIAEGPLIVKYMKQCAAETGIDKHIRYRHKLTSARWQSRDQAWTMAVETTSANGSKEQKYFRSKFMVLGTGYYDYDTPLEATIPGLKNFKGRVVHPQFWPEDLDYADKKVAVVGSGATAITMIPAMATTVKKITMIQRSPGYVISIPNRVAPLAWWMRWLPERWRNAVIRLRYLLMGFFYRRFLTGDTEKTKIFLAKMTQAQLPSHIPYDPHFKPSYAPWTQRMCLCPDGDFFKALHTKKADVTTGIIKDVEADGILMESGDKIEADIIVTATGLNMKYGGNAQYFVDGEEISWPEKYLWRGVMVQDMPNMAIVQGYTKASWTLGADATAYMVVRMIKHLDSNKFDSATPRIPKKDMVRITSAPGIMGLTSTYILAALHRLPKTSDEEPWKGRGNYLKDVWDAKYSSINKGMQFTRVPYS